MVDFVLLEAEHEGNVGAVSRVLANFGFNKLILVNPKCNLDSEFYKRAKHSKVVVKIVKKIPKYDLLIGTTAKVNTDYNLERLPLFANQLIDFPLPRKVAVLFGREGEGLHNDEISLCNLIVTINSSKEYSTLNLSHAVAIVAYELSKRSKNKIGDKIQMASIDDKKYVLKLLFGMINKYEFNQARKVRSKKIWTNVINKSIITKRECQGMMSLLRRIKDKC
ncbi:MAG: RNA methyltransferase [Candidatus Woesearchaeota archaeon]